MAVNSNSWNTMEHCGTSRNMGKCGSINLQELDRGAVAEKSAAAFCVEERRLTDAKKTEETLFLSRLSDPDGGTLLPGAPEEGEQQL